MTWFHHGDSFSRILSLSQPSHGKIQAAYGSARGGVSWNLKAGNLLLVDFGRKSLYSDIPISDKESIRTE